MSDEAHAAQLNTIISSLDSLKPLVNEIQSIKKLMEETNNNVSRMAGQMNNLEQENSHLKKQFSHLQNENAELKLRVEELEQYTRKDNVLISGIPYSTQENLREKVRYLADKMGVKLAEQEINTTHRLGDLKQAAPMTIVRLNNQDKKAEWIAQSKRQKLKGNNVGFDHNYPIYVTEQLTKQAIEILNFAR